MLEVFFFYTFDKRFKT